MNANYMALPGCVGKMRHEPFLKTADEIFFDVCTIFRVEKSYLLQNNKKRDRLFVVPRQVIMTDLALNSDPKPSLAQVGTMFSKDHSTVIHAIKTVKNLLDTDRNFKKTVGHLFKNTKFPAYKN
jgi:chromosomal replication initiator protein